MTTNRPLRVFLCHSSADKPAVRELYQKLRAEPWIEPWLDEEELFPGMDWNLEIEKAIKGTDVIIVCLSKGSITKEGYVQKEIKTALDFSDYKPEGTVFIIPVRLEDCKPPDRLSKWQYADYFEGQRERSLQRLLVSLEKRANSLGLKVKAHTPQREEKPVIKEQNDTEKYLEDFHKKYAKPLAELKTDKLTLPNGMEFMRVPAGEFLMGSSDDNKLASNNEKPQHILNIPYDYWMGRFPVTNEQINIYVKTKKFDYPVSRSERKKNHPVVDVTWRETVVYCKWLNSLLKDKLPLGLELRLPTEAEWEKAARGTDGREFPWGNKFDNQRCHMPTTLWGGTAPVNKFSPQGDSPYGCANMLGNIWEWTNSLIGEYPYNANDGREEAGFFGHRVLRGGLLISSWGRIPRCACRKSCGVDLYDGDHSFRIAIAPPLSK